MIEKIMFDRSHVAYSRSGFSKTKQSCSAHSVRGFTLIELVLVVALVSGAVVAAVKLPAHFTKSSQRDGVVNIEKK